MATNYPSGADTFASIDDVTKMSEEVSGRTHRAILNDMGDAVEAIETELGNDPSGTETNVVTRLARIEDGTRLASNSITAAQIAANAVGSSELADNAVDTAAIADSAVTSAKIADGTITATDVAADTFAPFGTVGNLLSAAQAVGTAAAGCGGCTQTGPVFTATGTAAFTAAYQGIPVTEGEIYTAQVTVSANTRVLIPSISWRNSGGSYISSSNLNTITAGAGGTSRVTAVAPSGAVTAWLYLIVNTGTGSIGDSVTVTQSGMWKGSAGKWAVPGTPIVGQSRIATNNAVDLSGTGVPESAITAAPGSTFLQTDSTTDVKGWLRWIKSTGTGSTGWVAGPEADTGWRQVALLNGWLDSGGLALARIRRVGSRVTFVVYGKAVGTSATDEIMYTMGSGWRPLAYSEGQDGILTNNPGATSAGNLRELQVTDSVKLRGLSSATTKEWRPSALSWTTNDSWPSSLP